MNMMSIMLLKERRDIRPLLLKCGVALTISFAGYLYTRIRIKQIKSPDSPPSPPPPVSDKVDYEGRLKIKENHESERVSVSSDSYENQCIRVGAAASSIESSPRARCSGDKDGLLLPEFHQLVREFDATTETTGVPFVDSSKINKKPPRAIRNLSRDDYEQEIENLKKRIRFLQERERKLEVQLLEFYGAKEQESVLMELQNRLKINNIEAKFFTMKIESLQVDNKRLEAQVADHSKVVLELEAAKLKIKQLKKKVRHETEQSKEQILKLAQRVANLRWQEDEATNSTSEVHSEVQRLKSLENEAEELRNSYDKLQVENNDLAQRLDSTQILANSVLEDPEREDLYKDMYCLRKENENLTKEVERFLSDRCADAEELVYLRWINACLRHELRNYHPPPGKTVARDLSKSLSPASELKAKRLILEYANAEDGDIEPSIVDIDFDHWPSSQPSYLTDHDGSPGSNTSPKHQTKKMKIFSKLMKLVRGKFQDTPLRRSYSGKELTRKYSFESPHHLSSGGSDPRSESQSPMLASSSETSNNSPLEYHQLSSLAQEYSKDTKCTNPKGECGSSQGGVKFLLGRRSSSPLIYRAEHEDDDEKSDLAKYAVALRDSRWTRKKSASFTAG